MLTYTEDEKAAVRAFLRADWSFATYVSAYAAGVLPAFEADEIADVMLDASRGRRLACAVAGLAYRRLKHDHPVARAIERVWLSPAAKAA